MPPLRQTWGDELKLVFPQAGAEPERFEALGFDHFFLQPMDRPRRPAGRVVGLSKIARLVDSFARRLTLQERLTGEIADALLTHLLPVAIEVEVTARHGCICCRGVRQPGIEVVTVTRKGNWGGWRRFPFLKGQQR